MAMVIQGTAVIGEEQSSASIGPCKSCGTKKWKVVAHCPVGCRSKEDAVGQKWLCNMCKEVKCCTGLRTCCKICTWCTRDLDSLRECKVCFTTFVDRQRLLGCGHRGFCRSCVGMQVDVTVGGGSVTVPCLEPKCQRDMSREEIETFASPNILQKMKDIQVALHELRAQNMSATDKAVLATGKAKQCPRCRVIIERNEGCASMHCTVCRMHFCWNCADAYSRCGGSTCKTMKRSKKEIIQELAPSALQPEKALKDFKSSKPPAAAGGAGNSGGGAGSGGATAQHEVLWSSRTLAKPESAWSRIMELIAHPWTRLVTFFSRNKSCKRTGTNNYPSPLLEPIVPLDSKRSPRIQLPERETIRMK